MSTETTAETPAKFGIDLDLARELMIETLTKNGTRMRDALELIAQKCESGAELPEIAAAARAAMPDAPEISIASAEDYDRAMTAVADGFIAAAKSFSKTVDTATDQALEAGVSETLIEAIASAQSARIEREGKAL